jgi:hypothetical protein
MILSNNNSKGSDYASRASTDPQVAELKSKIQDWSTCPTTDGATKRAIVDKLQIQLDSVVSAISTREARSADSRKNLGSRIDIEA